MTTNQAITEHLTWSHNVARRAHRKLPPSVDLEDLQQVASIAMVNCAETYDENPGKGYKKPTPFRIYAWRKVYYSCLMAYRGRHYRDVTHQEMWNEAKDGEAAPRWAEEHGAGPYSLVRAKQGALTASLECHTTEARAAHSTTLQALADAVLQLPPIHAAVISLRYFHSMTVVEVARELQISEGWCSQKGTEGLEMLKQELERKGIHGIEDVL